MDRRRRKNDELAAGAGGQLGFLFFYGAVAFAIAGLLLGGYAVASFLATRPLTAAAAAAAVCDPGYGSADCDICVVGTFSAGGTLDDCEACAAETYAATTGASECTPCLPRCNDGAPGTCSATTGECTVCDPGRGGALCEACPLGTFNAGNNTLENCTACPVGTFSAMVNTIECLPCPAECNTTCGNTTGACGTCGNGTATNVVAPVDLGTAAGFALLAYSTITNVPTSDITGNVGLSPGTGAAIHVTCVEVTGTIYAVDAAYEEGCETTAPALLTQAKADLSAAFDDAAGRTPDVTLNSGDNQLGGQTLIAGVYVVSEASTAHLTGTLTLDGEGDASAVWIFQFATDLVTAGSSVVQLTNCSQACNVFWQVGTSATIGGDSVFVGTILAAQSVTFGTGAIIAGGAALASNAQITLAQNAITTATCA